MLAILKLLKAEHIKTNFLVLNSCKIVKIIENVTILNPIDLMKP